MIRGAFGVVVSSVFRQSNVHTVPCGSHRHSDAKKERVGRGLVAGKTHGEAMSTRIIWAGLRSSSAFCASVTTPLNRPRRSLVVSIPAEYCG